VLFLIVLAKGGSKLETTTAQLARKSQVWSGNPEKVSSTFFISNLFIHYSEREIQHRSMKCPKTATTVAHSIVM
jgi:hypothetical protein